MKTQITFPASLTMIVPGAAFCVFLLCAGCLRHKAVTAHAYRIDDVEGMSILVPPATPTADGKPLQTTNVVLPVAHSELRLGMHEECKIEGPLFSLHSDTTSLHSTWVVRSPSASGWATMSSANDIHAQWRLFLRKLAQMSEKGCFGPSVTAQSVRIAIAKTIPLPAEDVVDFVYSDQADRYVDLAPGMQLQMQGLLTPATVNNTQSAHSLQVWTVIYEVVSNRDGGVRIQRGHVGESGGRYGAEDKQILTLGQRFAQTPLLRIFLQGFSDTEVENGALLVGASNAAHLEALTDRIQQTSSEKCVALQAPACMQFAPDSVSLASFVWLNGHRMPSPFGAPLAFLLFQMPQSKQASALQSARVSRQLGPNDTAVIEFTHTMEGARQLLLLPGDRVEWKTD